MDESRAVEEIALKVADCIARRDADALARLLAPGFCHRTPGETSSDAIAFLEGIRQIPGEIVFIRLASVTVDVSMDNALMTGIQHAQVRIDGALVDDRRAFVDWFVKLQGEWRICVAVDLFSAPAPPSTHRLTPLLPFPAHRSIDGHRSITSSGRLQASAEESKHGKQSQALRSSDSPCDVLGLCDGAALRRCSPITGNGYWSEIAYWIAAGVITDCSPHPLIAGCSRLRGKRIGALHGAGNVVVCSRGGGSPTTRRNPVRGYLLAFVGGGLALFTGWMGGELVDRLSVGVDDGAHVNAPSSLTTRRVRA